MKIQRILLSPHFTWNQQASLSFWKSSFPFPRLSYLSSFCLHSGYSFRDFSLTLMSTMNCITDSLSLFTQSTCHCIKDSQVKTSKPNSSWRSSTMYYIHQHDFLGLIMQPPWTKICGGHSQFIGWSPHFLAWQPRASSDPPCLSFLPHILGPPPYPPATCILCSNNTHFWGGFSNTYKAFMTPSVWTHLSFYLEWLPFSCIWPGKCLLLLQEAIQSLRFWRCSRQVSWPIIFTR